MSCNVFDDLEGGVDIRIVVNSERQCEVGLFVVCDIQIVQCSPTNLCVIDRIEDLRPPSEVVTLITVGQT